MQQKSSPDISSESNIAAALARGLPDNWNEAILDVIAEPQGAGIESYRFVIRGLDGRLARSPSDELMAAVRGYAARAAQEKRPWKRILITMARGGPLQPWDFHCEETAL